MRQIAAEAYQVIGALASTTDTFDKPGVQKALNYFGDIASDGKATRSAPPILPWGIDDEP